MPVISMFYGLIVRMYYFDTDQHHLPHIHVEFAEDVAVFAIETAELIAGNLPPTKVRLVVAWIEIHRDELMADWKLAAEGGEVFKIDPLR